MKLEALSLSGGLLYDHGRRRICELRRHQDALRRAVLDVGRRDRVLDIGCGVGQTTRDVALMARDGSVLGIDTAEQALRQARRLTLAAGLRNVDYVRGDAAHHPFPPASFDVAISRFGTMFFADPLSAFTNIRGALRPAARLVMMVWQSARRNAWAVSIHRALVGDDAASPERLFGSSVFSLGDAHTVEGILQAAGFAEIAFQEVHEPVYYGSDVESALAFVGGFSSVSDVVESQPTAERARTLGRLRDLMAAHRTHDGVWFDSHAWIVIASCGYRRVYTYFSRRLMDPDRRFVP